MSAAEPVLVSVVVVNWNGRALLERCLDALDAQTYSHREVVVVDNGSTDGSPAWLAARQPPVHLLRNDHNRGFAAANNQGIRAARGRYVALLNNDAFADRTWLAALVAAAEAHPRAGMVASLMLFDAQPDIVNSAGVCVDRFGVSWDRAGGVPAADVAPAVVAVVGARAGAALYRREMDCRARWLGWQAVLAPGARVLHFASATSGEGSAFKTRCLARNKLLLLLKNYPAPQLWRYAPGLVLYDLLSLFNSLVAQRTLAGLRGRFAAAPMLGRALRRRRQVQAARRATSAEIFDSLAPPAWPWQVQRRYQHLRSRAARPRL
jgi:GT2 family glycosyltransferase